MNQSNRMNQIKSNQIESFSFTSRPKVTKQPSHRCMVTVTLVLASFKLLGGVLLDIGSDIGSAVHILISILTRSQQQKSDNNNMRFSSCYHIAAIALVVVVLSSPNANAFQNNNVQTRTTPATPLTNRPRSLSSSPSSPSSSSFSQLLMAKDPKETTWERITGPKLFKTVTNWQVRTYVTALFP
jgi:hypothetical protein